MLVLFMAAMAAIGGDPSDERQLAYGLAYSAYVSHACPGWEQHLEVLPAGFLPDAASFGTAWAEGTARQKAYRKGGADAAKDRRADERYCEHPLDRRIGKAPILGRLAVDRRAGSAPR